MNLNWSPIGLSPFRMKMLRRACRVVSRQLPFVIWSKFGWLDGWIRSSRALASLISSCNKCLVKCCYCRLPLLLFSKQRTVLSLNKLLSGNKQYIIWNSLYGYLDYEGHWSERLFQEYATPTPDYFFVILNLCDDLQTVCTVLIKPFKMPSFFF